MLFWILIRLSISVFAFLPVAIMASGKSDLSLKDARYVYTTAVPSTEMMTGMDLFNGLTPYGEIPELNPDQKSDRPKGRPTEHDIIKNKIFVMQSLNLNLIGPGTNVLFVISDDGKFFGFAFSNGRFDLDQENGSIADVNYPKRILTNGKYVWPMDSKGRLLPGNRIMQSNGPHGSIEGVLKRYIEVFHPEKEPPKYFIGGHVGVDINNNVYFGYIAGMNAGTRNRNSKLEESVWIARQDRRSLAPRFRKDLHNGFSQAFYGRNFEAVVESAPENLEGVQHFESVQYFPLTRKLPDRGQVRTTYFELLIEFMSEEAVIEYLTKLDLKFFLGLYKDFLTIPIHRIGVGPQARIAEIFKNRIYETLSNIDESMIGKYHGQGKGLDILLRKDTILKLSPVLEEFLLKNFDINNTPMVRFFILSLFRFGENFRNFIPNIQQILKLKDENLNDLLVSLIFTEEEKAKLFIEELKNLYKNGSLTFRSKVFSDILKQLWAHKYFADEILARFNSIDSDSSTRKSYRGFSNEGSARVVANLARRKLFEGNLEQQKIFVDIFLTAEWSKDVFAEELNWIVHSPRNSLELYFIKKISESETVNEPKQKRIEIFSAEVDEILSHGSAAFLKKALPFAFRNNFDLKFFPKTLQMLTHSKDMKLKRLLLMPLFGQNTRLDKNAGLAYQILEAASPQEMVIIGELFNSPEKYKEMLPKAFEVYEYYLRRAKGPCKEVLERNDVAKLPKPSRQSHHPRKNE